jgi:hypothetical protein
MAKDSDSPHFGGVPFAPAAALQELGAFILGDHTLHLQE